MPVSSPVIRFVILIAVFGGALWLTLTLKKTFSASDEPGVIELSEDLVVDPATLPGLQRLDQESIRLAAAVTPSVVSIDTEGLTAVRQLTIRGVRERLMRTQGLGSGVIVSRHGFVVTNFHVIEGKQRFVVTLHNKERLEAIKVGEDPDLDIAILKIKSDRDDFQPLPFGDSDSAKVGSLVFAIGNPFGLGETFTAGRISAKERSISDTQRDLIQTDAAINPGNSGGPLINIKGEIIGINVAIFSTGKQSPGFQGISFAIPSNDVRETLESIRDRGVPPQGYLGISLEPLNDHIRIISQYQQQYGALVTQVVKSSPADAAGLQQLDVLESFNGEKVKSVDQVISMVRRSRTGSQCNLVVWRQGKRLELQATIADGVAKRAELSQQGGRGGQRLPGGIARGPEPPMVNQLPVRDFTDAERDAAGRGGVVVDRLPSNSPYARYLRSGDIIVKIGKTEVENKEEFDRQLAAAQGTDQIFSFFRRGRQYRIRLRVGD